MASGLPAGSNGHAGAGTFFNGVIVREHAAGAVKVGEGPAAAQHSQPLVGLDPEAHEGVVVEQAAAGPGVALGKAQYVGVEDGFTNAPEARLQPAAEEAAGGEHEVVRLEQLILPCWLCTPITLSPS